MYWQQRGGHITTYGSMHISHGRNPPGHKKNMYIYICIHIHSSIRPMRHNYTHLYSSSLKNKHGTYTIALLGAFGVCVLSEWPLYGAVHDKQMPLHKYRCRDRYGRIISDLIHMRHARPFATSWDAAWRVVCVPPTPSCKKSSTTYKPISAHRRA